MLIIEYKKTFPTLMILIFTLILTSEKSFCQDNINENLIHQNPLIEYGFETIDKNDQIYFKEENSENYILFYNPEIGLIPYGAQGSNSMDLLEKLIDNFWYSSQKEQYIWQSSLLYAGGYQSENSSGRGGKQNPNFVRQESNLKEQLIANGFTELKQDLNLWYHQANANFSCIVKISEDGNFIHEIYFPEIEHILLSKHINIINLEFGTKEVYSGETMPLLNMSLERPDQAGAVFEYEIFPRKSYYNGFSKNFSYTQDIIDWSNLGQKLKKYNPPTLDSNTGFTYGGINVPFDVDLEEIRGLDEIQSSNIFEISTLHFIRGTSIQKIESLMQPYDGIQDVIRVSSGFLNAEKGDHLLTTLDEDNKKVLLDLKTTHQQLALLVNLAVSTVRNRGSHAITRIRFFGVDFEITINPFSDWAGLNHSPFYDGSTGGQDYLIKNLSVGNNLSLFITDLHINSFIHDYGFYEGKGVGKSGTDLKTGITYTYRVDPEQIMKVFSTEGTVESSFLRNPDFPLERLFKLQYN